MYTQWGIPLYIGICM